MIQSELVYQIDSFQLHFRMEVAIKEAKSKYASEEMLDEAKVMMKVAKHNHIVNFQGISINNDQVYMLLEFCHSGSIEEFLKSNSTKYKAKLERHDYMELVNWSSQVADAMKFMVESSIIHVRKLLIYLCTLNDFIS